MLENLKQDVRRANIHLVNHGFDSFLRGSISAVDRDNSLVVISPGGIFYDEITADMMVVTDFSGNTAEGSLEPADDVLTHIEIYKAFPNIGAIVQYNTPYATAWAQSGRDIPPYGAFYAKGFKSVIPCTRNFAQGEIEDDYEKNVGLVIAQIFGKNGIDPDTTPAVTVFNHGPYSWGENCFSAVHNAILLENIAKMSYLTEKINPDVTMINKTYFDK